jgi:hypothetical protein
MRTLMLIAASSLLVACGPRTPVANINGLAHQEQAAIRRVRIYDETQLDSVDYAVLGVVDGYSCASPTWVLGHDARVVEQLKYHAWTLGANGLAHIQYSTDTGASDCEEAVAATGDAIHVADSN